MPSHHRYCTEVSQLSHLFFHSAQKQTPLFMTQHEQSTDWLKCPTMLSVIGCSSCSCVGHADQECQKPQEEVCFFYGAAVTLCLLYDDDLLFIEKTFFKQKEVICMSYLCLLHIWWVYFHKAVSSIFYIFIVNDKGRECLRLSTLNGLHEVLEKKSKVKILMR